MMSVDFEDSITAAEVERIVGEIEAEVAQRWPLVKRLYIRPQHGAGLRPTDTGSTLDC